VTQYELQYDDKLFDHLLYHRASQEVGVSHLVDPRQLNTLLLRDCPPPREALPLDRRTTARLPLTMLLSIETPDQTKIDALSRLLLGLSGGDNYHARKAFKMGLSMEQEFAEVQGILQ